MVSCWRSAPVGARFGKLTLATGTDGALASAVAARAAAVLDAARLLESEQRARVRTEALQGVTSALSGAVTPEEVGLAVWPSTGALGGTRGDGLRLRVPPDGAARDRHLGLRP